MVVVPTHSSNLDSILIDVVTPELLAINASTGRLSFQSQRVRFKDYTLLMENQDDYGYRVLHWYQGIRSMWSIFPNINRRPDENNPMEACKAALLDPRPVVVLHVVHDPGNTPGYYREVHGISTGKNRCH